MNREIELLSTEGCSDDEICQSLMRLKGYITDSNIPVDSLIRVVDDIIGGCSLLAKKLAISCIANMILLSPKSKSTVMKSGIVSQALDCFPTGEHGLDFVICRLLFLLTAGDSENTLFLLENELLDKLLKHFTSLSLSHMSETGPLLSECLKLFYNISLYCDKNDERLQPFNSTLIRLLLACKNQQVIPQSMVHYLINALHGIPFNQELVDAMPVADALLQLLQNLLFNPNHGSEAYEALTCSLLVLLTLYFTQSQSHVKVYMKQTMLPSDADRKKPLGRGDNIAAKLIQLLSSTSLIIRDSAGVLLLELSNGSLDEMAFNIGYGNSAAMVMNGATGLKDVSASGMPINPITGQFKQPGIMADDMTEDEKLREAERLFVLFDRLKKTGVVNIKNPLER